MVALSEGFYDDQVKLSKEINKIKRNVSAGSQIKIAAAVINLTKDSLQGAGDLIKKMITINVPEDNPKKDNPNPKVTGLTASQ